MVRSWIKRHPVLSYVVLTVVWSWSIWSLLFVLIEPGGLLHDPPPLSFVFVVVGGFGPSLIGWMRRSRRGGREWRQNPFGTQHHPAALP